MADSQETGGGTGLPDADNIVNTVREALVVLDGTLRVRRANRSFYDTFRVQEEDAEGRILYDLGNGQWAIPRLRTLLEEILPQSSVLSDYEVAHDFPSIGRKVMLLNARRILREGSHAETILLAIEDITDRRRAEDERRELETRFTSLVKNIRDHSIFTLDPEGRITSWNVEAERILGYTDAEALGQHFSFIFTPEDVSEGIPALELRTALEQGRAEDERWHMRKNGERFWALGIVTPTHDAQGRHTGFSKILRDMTDRKRAQDLLAQQAEALREADRRKDEFLAMLAHELRNPLAPIRTAADRLRLKVPHGSELHAVIDVVDRQTGHLVRLVDDLMDVSRITRGKITLHKSRTDLNPVVAQAVETARPLIDARRHDLSYTPPQEPVTVEADTTRLTQALSNILSNAAKYTENGGRIWLTSERDGGEAVVRVRDTGIGIAPEMLPKIFDLFAQANRSLDRSQGGLGIGLTVAKRLVEMHGGSLTAHSAGEGQGSEFVIRLPLVKEPGADAEGVRQVRGEPTGQAPRRILLVDDLVEVAEDMACLLREAFGHEVRTAHDGPTALRLAADFRPDLVLLDIGLPGMNGCEVARRLRQQPGLGDAVLVALTGWGQEEDRRKTKEVGFDHHLVKPVGLKELEPLLASLKWIDLPP